MQTSCSLGQLPSVERKNGSMTEPAIATASIINFLSKSRAVELLEGATHGATRLG